MSPLLYFWLAFKASLFSTGGMGNLPSLHADLLSRGWATDRQFAESLAVGQISPGPNGLWVISLGYLVDGLRGALLTLVAITLPPLLILAVERLYRRVKHHPAVEGFVRGLGLAVVGIFIPVMFRLLASVGWDMKTMLITVAAIAAGATRRVPVIAVLIVAGIVSALAAHAAPPPNEGSIYFPSLSTLTSTPIRVYVDGKPARYQNQNGTYDPVMPAGRHLLQIEAKVGGNLQAMRCLIVIKAGERQAVRVILRPVVVGTAAGGVQIYCPPGVPGPQGMPGPPALPMRPLPEGHDIFTLREIIHTGLEILLDDLQGQVDAALSRLPAYAGPVYVYASKRLLVGPAGPDGPAGLPGRAGIPAEVALIQTPEGELALDWLQRQRSVWEQSLTEARSRLADLERRIDALGASPQASRSYVSTIAVLTPEFKQELDRSLKPLFALPPPSESPCWPGIDGSPG
ncbi:MAG TPA: chromate transporter, partial [Chthonomonadaceae bacterium]|nr:chromate transporter [Chthonomonadaceae bacterium]